MCGRLNNVEREGICQNWNYMASVSVKYKLLGLLDNTDHDQTQNVTLTDKNYKAQEDCDESTMWKT